MKMSPMNKSYVLVLYNFPLIRVQQVAATHAAASHLYSATTTTIGYTQSYSLTIEETPRGSTCSVADTSPHRHMLLQSALSSLPKAAAMDGRMQGARTTC